MEAVANGGTTFRELGGLVQLLRRLAHEVGFDDQARISGSGAGSSAMVTDVGAGTASAGGGTDAVGEKPPVP